jgi:hypothetical protein
MVPCLPPKAETQGWRCPYAYPYAARACTQAKGNITAMADRRLVTLAGESPAARPRRMRSPGVRHWRAEEAVESSAYWADRWGDRPAGQEATGHWARVLAARKARAMAEGQQECLAAARGQPAARRPGPPVRAAGRLLRTEVWSVCQACPASSDP